MSLVFFGTPEFARPALRALNGSNFRPALIVTAPDKSRGRGNKISPTPVKTWALEQKIPLITPQKLDASFRAELKALSPAVGVLAAYGKLIPQAVIDVFPKGILNIHPSLLPKYRGATPIQGAILAGEQETGVTIMLLAPGLDQGPIISYETLGIQKNENAGHLESRLAELGAKLLIKTLPDWLNGKIQPREQDNALATFTKPIKKADCQLNPQKPATQLARQVRAQVPRPGAYLMLDNSRLKILAAQALDQKSPKPIGSVFVLAKEPALATADGLLILKLVQPPGKNFMTGAEFARGYLSPKLN